MIIRSHRHWQSRVAAGMIHYGVLQGVKPMFLTEKANLFSTSIVIFSNWFRSFKTFIVNGRESKTDIKDEDATVIYQLRSARTNDYFFRTIPAQYDFILGTYHNSTPGKKPEA
jgi:hypothetical protein